jgi:hypothetical protein
LSSVLISLLISVLNSVLISLLNSVSDLDIITPP